MSTEQAATICGCSVAEVERFRREVLPRVPGLAPPDPQRFSASEVVAIAMALCVRRWPGKQDVLAFVGRFALKPPPDRAWILVYESRKGLRYETPAFVFPIRRPVGFQRVTTERIFDPAPTYEAFDRAVEDGDRT